MSMQTKTIGRMPTDHGPYDPQLAYGKKFTVTLFDCGWESKHDNNTSAPATLNAQAGTITENTTDWKKVWGSYKQWLIDNGYQKMDASKVKDGNNTQHDINADINGRVTTLEGAVGTGGSVDERIAAEGARHYLKSETYTKEEVNGMITTPEQGFESVSATSETTAATDVLPATGDADTIYRVANWDGSQYDTSVYSEYSWNTSTNTYIKLSTKQVGIDDEPTAESDNLVKSGGAVSYINDFTKSCVVYHDTQDSSLPIRANVGDVLNYTIKNLTGSAGYFGLKINNGTIYSTTLLVEAGATVSGTLTLTCEPSTIDIINTNHKDIICVIENKSQSNNTLSKDSRTALNLLDNYVLEPQINSYTQSFNVKLDADKKYYLKIKNNSAGDGYFSATVYDQNGGNALFEKNGFLISAGQTVIVPFNLNQVGTYITITNINSKAAEYSIYFLDEVKEALLNDKVPYGINEFITSNSENFTLSVADDVLTATKTTSGSYCKIDFRNSTPVSAGNFIFVKMKIKSTVSEWVRVVTWTVGADQRADFFFLEANVERVIAFRGSNASTTGTLNVMIDQFEELNLATSVITIKDFEVYVNGYTNIKLPNFDYSGNNKTFIVDKNGGGHFYSISNAVNYIKNSFDVVNNSYTVFVKNGIYDKEKNDLLQEGYPYAVIYKGDNRISIIGESRDNTIIRWTNNSVCEYKIIEVGSSPCIIGNLTVENLKGVDYTEAKGHNPYCLHIDLGADLDTFGAYKTEIYNCRLYDECAAPVGAGLKKNQTIHVHDCFIETNSKMNEVFDTLYIHGHASGQSTYDSTMAVEIEKNILVNKTEGKALTLPDVGQSTFGTIPCTIIGNLLYSSDPDNIIDPNAATRYNMVPYCMGNNVQALNK